jgi:hypothetical protein
MDKVAPLAASLVADILDFIAADGCTDDQFDALALKLFAHQFAANSPYRSFCQRRGVTVRKVKSWRDIPAAPIDAFKATELRCAPPAPGERVFMTSGTTRGDVKGRNHHPTIAVWDLSMRALRAALHAGDGAQMPMAAAVPDEPSWAIRRWRATCRWPRAFGAPGSRSYVSVAGGLDVDGVCAALRRAQAQGQPMRHARRQRQLRAPGGRLAGARHAATSLPPGSRILDTGGYKGQSRELAPDAFYDACRRPSASRASAASTCTA